MSTMGVLSSASRFRTRILVSSIATICALCSRSEERVLNTPRMGCGDHHEDARRYVAAGASKPCQRDELGAYHEVANRRAHVSGGEHDATPASNPTSAPQDPV